MQAITILESPSKEAESVGPLSDQGLFRPKNERRKRNLESQDLEDFFASPLQREIIEHEEKEKKDLKEISATEMSKSSSSSPLGIAQMADDVKPRQLTPSTKATLVDHPSSISGFDTCSDLSIPLVLDPSSGHFSTSFVIYITDSKQDGLYSMFFHNCFNYRHRSRSRGSRVPVNFHIDIEEKNTDSYLSAGEMPLPALYQMLAILFFLSGCFWVFILKKNGSEQVYRIHWIMAALVFLKSLSLFFHGINYTKIATNGIHMESWAILYYITHLLKGGLLFFTIGCKPCPSSSSCENPFFVVSVDWVRMGLCQAYSFK